jgi:hypothetical protein
MAQVTVGYPAEGAMLAYRETRFYQKTTEEWLRIDLDPKLMGPFQILETAHFTIHYRSVDAGAVYEIAPKLEQLYAKMRRDFGVPVADAASSYTIEVVTDRLSNAYFSLAKRTITIPSPTLLSVPVEMTAATVVYQSMVYPLAGMVVVEAVEPHLSPWKATVVQWKYIVSALRLWALWEDNGPLAVGRKEMVRWFYERAQVERLKARQPLPDAYAHLCRTYRIWRIAPRALFIPLDCNEGGLRDLSAQHYPTMPPPIREQDSPAKRGVTLVAAFDSTVATETIIEYVVAAYGREKLPLLIAALGQHTAIDTLIPAVFGVSPVEFEAGWQAYLAEQYGVK